MTENQLDGKIIIVTGAAGGLGRAMVEALISNGARVAAVDVASDRLDALTALSGPGEILPLAADLKDINACTAIAPRTIEALGGLHGLVNNAGIGLSSIRENYYVDNIKFWDVPEDRWQAIFDVNVRAPFALTKECLPLLTLAGESGEHASVINIASIDGIRIPGDNDWAYGHGKAGLIHLTRQWAGRLGNKGGKEGGRNITFNVIAPGPFPGMLDHFLATEEGEAYISGVTTIGRVGKPEDMGATCVFLSSRGGSYITGALIPVDGGFLVGPSVNG